MKVLVTVAFYPKPNGEKKLYYVHSRNLYYVESGINVTVLNFDATEEYVLDGIKVITLDSFKQTYEYQQYDLLILHAANIRNHYKFLLKYGQFFKKKVFIFHGHEILHINKYYPMPYTYIGKKKFQRFFRNMYDSLKLLIWRKYFEKNYENLELVFVSNWLYSQFLIETNLNKELLSGRVKVIPNSIGKFFEINKYHPQNVIYDFITVRSNLDGSTYCIDILLAEAKKNPKYNFCIIGSGDFFKYNELPPNIHLVNEVLTHELLSEYINRSLCALMPVRHDTHGVMACELAAYGIPLVTSDIDICREVFSGCHNILLLPNDRFDVSGVIEFFRTNKKLYENKKFYAMNTIYKEIKFLKSL